MTALTTLGTPELIAIILMAAATYSTRLLGWLMLRGRPLSPKVRRILDAAPGCVLVSIAAPYFFTTNPAHLIALAVAVAVSRRYGLAVTVLSAVGTAALLGQVFARL